MCSFIHKFFSLPGFTLINCPSVPSHQLDYAGERMYSKLEPILEQEGRKIR